MDELNTNAPLPKGEAITQETQLITQEVQQVSKKTVENILGFLQTYRTEIIIGGMILGLAWSIKK